MREQGIVSASLREEERQFEATLRPNRLADFAGQAKVKENLAIAIEAAKRRGEAMDHVLLYGPPGLGKTTLAGIIAAELGVGLQQTSGPVLQKKLTDTLRLYQTPYAAVVVLDPASGRVLAMAEHSETDGGLRGLCTKAI